MTLTDLILVLIILAAASYFAIECLRVLNTLISQGVKFMSKLTELNAAADALIAAYVAAKAGAANTTPDADVQAVVDKINLALNPPAPTP